MPLGMPVSQPCGVFQGRSDMFSDSVLAQPPVPSAAKTSSRSNTQRELETRNLHDAGWAGMTRSPSMTSPEFPTGHDVGDAAILLHAAHDDLGDELAVAIDQQLAALQNALVFSDVEHHEIPLRIRHQHFALQARRQGDEEVWIPVNRRARSRSFLTFLQQNLVLRLGAGQVVLECS